MYCKVVIEGPSHDYTVDQRAEKNWCEVHMRDFRDTQADRQTDRQTNRHTDTFTTMLHKKSRLYKVK